MRAKCASTFLQCICRCGQEGAHAIPWTYSARHRPGLLPLGRFPPFFRYFGREPSTTHKKLTTGTRTVSAPHQVIYIYTFWTFFIPKLWFLPNPNTPPRPFFLSHHAWPPVRLFRGSHSQSEGGSVWYPFSGGDRACPRPVFLLPCRSKSRSDSQKAISVAKIGHPEVMDEATHRPKMGGLVGPCMGTIDRNFKCQTCGEGMSECPGHFGHIELARPAFHRCVIFLSFHSGFCYYDLFLAQVSVKKILESICVNCGKLKADIVSGAV